MLPLDEWFVIVRVIIRIFRKRESRPISNGTNVAF